jgi:hypothetical protein
MDKVDVLARGINSGVEELVAIVCTVLLNVNEVTQGSVNNTKGKEI